MDPSSSPPTPVAGYGAASGPGSGVAGARRGIRPAVAIALGAVVVVAALLGGLYVAGIGPFHRSPSPSPTGPLTFRQAEAAAGPTVRGYGGGQWDLVGAGAASLRASESIPVLTIQQALQPVLGSCTLDWLTSESTIAVPAFSGNASAGISPFWVLAYRNASALGGSLLVVSVVNGSAQLTALLPSTGPCLAYTALTPYISAISSTAIDSPAALAAAESAGGRAFLTAHPEANVTMGLSGSFGIAPFLGPSDWQVAFSLCSLAPSSSTQEPQFNATVDAATGTVTAAQTTMQNCTLPSSPTPPFSTTYTLSESLGLSAATAAGSGSDHWMNVSITAANDSIEFGNLSLFVIPASGSLAPTPSWSLQALSTTGTVLAEYNLTTGLCESGAAVALSVGDRLSIFSAGTSLSGGSLAVTGVGAFAGYDEVPFP